MVKTLITIFLIVVLVVW